MLRRLLHERSDRKCGARSLKPHPDSRDESFELDFKPTWATTLVGVRDGVKRTYIGRWLSPGWVTCGRRHGKSFFRRSAALVGCGHVSGLLMRQVWPLALMLCADRVPNKRAHF